MDCKIGKNTKIAASADVYKCVIGNNCKISAFVYIEEDVVIGDNCKIRPFTFIPTGVTIGNGVFIGPGVTFTNDKYPRAINKDGTLKNEEDWTLVKTVVKDGASIGTGAIILCGVTIGRHAVIGAGAVVTKNVSDGTIIYNRHENIISEAKW